MSIFLYHSTQKNLLSHLKVFPREYDVNFNCHSPSNFQFHLLEKQLVADTPILFCTKTDTSFLTVAKKIRPFCSDPKQIRLFCRDTSIFELVLAFKSFLSCAAMTLKSKSIWSFKIPNVNFIRELLLSTFLFHSFWMYLLISGDVDYD